MDGSFFHLFPASKEIGVAFLQPFEGFLGGGIGGVGPDGRLVARDRRDGIAAEAVVDRTGGQMGARFARAILARFRFEHGLIELAQRFGDEGLGFTGAPLTG